MEALILCDNCREEFNKSTNIPKILPKCGHTLCLQCIKSLKNSACTQCNTKQNIESPDSLLVNDKLLKILDVLHGPSSNSSQNNIIPPQQNQMSSNKRTNNIVGGSYDYEQEYTGGGGSNNEEDLNNRVSGTITNNLTGKVFCFKHQDKEIEYFCKICHSIVCPKCMFAEHNGHELAQLEDVTNIIKQNVYDLHKLLLNTKRINDDNRNYIIHIKEEVLRLKDQQLRNIDKGFGDLIKKLEEKREELKNEFSNKYLTEENKILSKTQMLDQNSEEIQNIEIIYDELIKFIEKNNDAKILTKINDISSFISKSIEDLEMIAKKKGFDKNETLIDPQLKPLTLNVQKAYEIISKFNMVPTTKKTSDNLNNAAQPQQKSQAQQQQIQNVGRGYSSGASNYGNDYGYQNAIGSGNGNIAGGGGPGGPGGLGQQISQRKGYQEDQIEHNAQNIQQQLTQLRTNFLKDTNGQVGAQNRGIGGGGGGIYNPDY